MSTSVPTSLPNLVIAGVTKAGTTSLHRYLSQHSAIAAADVKEVDHYAPMVAGEAPPPLAAYARHFSGAEGFPFRLDASPRYFIGGRPLVARMAADLRGPRVLITLREPTARLWSAYTYKRSKGRLPEGMGFAAFFERCVTVYERGELRQRGTSTYRSVGTGVYAEHLADWLDVLGPALRIVFAEHLAAAPREEIAGLCSWLGVGSAEVDHFDLAARNVTVHPRSLGLRRLADRANAALGPAIGAATPVGRLARRAYARLNTGSLRETLDDADRRAVEDFYRPTLPPLARLLDEHGVVERPAWCPSSTPAVGG